jgi:multiple sugar transport system substrate-binding protein
MKRRLFGRLILSTHLTAIASKTCAPAGFAGKLGYASAGAGADFIVVNMVAEAASGSKTPKEAAERAQKRAERYYKV